MTGENKSEFLGVIGRLTSLSIDWETPQDVFNALNAEFHFTLDACASKENAKCENFYSIEDDAFKHEWRGVVFMNPPYGDPEQPCKSACRKQKCDKRGFHITDYIPGIGDWIRKAYESGQQGATVVCLIPARTETKWWHEFCMKGEIRFVKGRLSFGRDGGSAPFSSAVIIFKQDVQVGSCASWTYVKSAVKKPSSLF